MSTVVRRNFRSVPHRDAMSTWLAIVELLTQGKGGDRRRELEAVAGIASSLIADQAPSIVPIIATCNGPRTRIYCCFDDDALDESEANEEKLGFDPLTGNWQVSLPCASEDLNWVQSALLKFGTRIIARDLSKGTDLDDPSSAEKAEIASSASTINFESFFEL